ncbi:uncharacterized protein MONBRDRAFT_38186 [Monosiga brevicollis MX1]|uniref:Elongation of fatty acids protein n=1 Tax=Monosiga brevicollis TaxID=81824 RepID=A9V666_MONBE|nr:uncharacterized protein MONBRDRAFT_38186 [Monosiga brevicollis MX1]EDQ87018.1 predicted protein [Monosiga brevicollis MX1]|eukprot:XP_001748257.1 hypothetical protein [Monosiga brevicollis MX1]
MSLFSAWMCVGITSTLWRNLHANSYDATLLACDREWTLRQGMEYWFWWFHASKYIEMIDTVLLVLAKKHEQGLPVAWYLQLYHHAITPSIGWHAWFLPVDSSFMGVITNTFVHVVMYAYFAVAVRVPAIRKYGRFVTMLQLAQFAFCIFYAFVAAYGVFYCHSSFFSWCWIQAVYMSMLIFFVLFDRAKRAHAKSAAKADKAQ